MMIRYIMTDFVEKILFKDGCGIHYWISYNGNRPWIILLHGACADHHLFDGQVPALKGKYNLLLWDARGHGLSRPMGDDFTIKLLTDDLVTLMNREGIEKASFIGQSMGGNIAQEIAFYHSDKVESLILADCTCNTNRFSKVKRYAMNLVPFITYICPWKVAQRICYRSGAVKKETREYLKQTFMKISKKDFIKIFSAATNCLHYEKGYKINKKIMLICGEYDYLGNLKKSMYRWASYEPKSEYHVLKNAGHSVNKENPEDFNKLMTEFLYDLYKN